MTDLSAPLDVYRDRVRPEWIDHNRHMNMGYYLVVFDFATDAFFAWVGLGEEHRRTRAITTFCLEAHVTYHREVRADDPLRFTTMLLGHDDKRIHYISEMYVAEFHVYARSEIKNLKDLQGKKVGFNTKGSAANITGKIVFERPEVVEKSIK